MSLHQKTILIFLDPILHHPPHIKPLGKMANMAERKEENPKVKDNPVYGIELGQTCHRVRIQECDEGKCIIPHLLAG